MSHRVIRKRDLRSVTGLSPRHIDRLEKAGQFPKRVQLSSQSVGWIEQEIADWLASRKRGPLPTSLTTSE